jgi:hypothetical protein
MYVYMCAYISCATTLILGLFAVAIESAINTMAPAFSRPAVTMHREIVAPQMSF